MATLPVTNVKRNAAQVVADRLDLTEASLKQVLKATAFRAERPVTDDEFMALMVVANNYGLNPVTKELYAFPNRGGVVPIVSVDGWVRITTSHPDYDGVELLENLDDKGQVVSVTAKFYRKSNGHPTVVTEYMDECNRGTEVWKKWPRRMLRHKAYIQGARVAFGFSGIYDEDEAERIIEVTPVQDTPVEMPRKRPLNAPEQPIEPEVVDMPQQPETDAERPIPAKKGVVQTASEMFGGTPVAQDRPTPAGYKMIQAKFDGLCKGCGTEVKKGTEVAYSSAKGIFHPDCATQ